MIEENRITEDWEGACILGTLPAAASDIRIANNTCVKTGVCGAFPVGIGIRRTDSATAPAQNIAIDGNTIRSDIGWIYGQYPPLDMGGIFLSGLHDNVTVTNNRITRVGPRGIYFHPAADVTNAMVTNNTITWGELVIAGTVTGTTSPNTVVAYSP